MQRSLPYLHESRRSRGKRGQARFGVAILDGIGSTEMLHIFISNNAGDVDIRIVDEHGHPVKQGETGELQVHGPGAAIMYWINHVRSRNAFQGSWTCTGDKYAQREDGRYVRAGRNDDMLKVSGL
jgi:benzoate-CoA ligase